jgi:protein SCO1/2
MRLHHRLVGSMCAAVLCIVIVACGDDAPVAREFVGYRNVPGQPVGAIALPDVSNDGRDLALRAAPGELLITYFGYTSCPDVCPTTLADLRRALRDLGDDAARVDLAMVTVDPERDTAEVLTGYVQSFVPGAHALRTDDPASLRAAADAFGASYSVTTADDGRVEVAHSAAMYVVDPNGTVTLTWPFGVAADDLRLDLEALLAEVAP